MFEKSLVVIGHDEGELALLSEGIQYTWLNSFQYIWMKKGIELTGYSFIHSDWWTCLSRGPDDNSPAPSSSSLLLSSDPSPLCPLSSVFNYSLIALIFPVPRRNVLLKKVPGMGRTSQGYRVQWKENVRDEITHLVNAWWCSRARYIVIERRQGWPVSQDRIHVLGLAKRDGWKQSSRPRKYVTVWVPSVFCWVTIWGLSLQLVVFIVFEGCGPFRRRGLASRTLSLVLIYILCFLAHPMWTSLPAMLLRLWTWPFLLHHDGPKFSWSGAKRSSIFP